MQDRDTPEVAPEVTIEPTTRGAPIIAFSGVEHVMVESIARVCHEANRAYCLTIGDYSQGSWDMAPEWQKESARNGVKFHMDSIASGIRRTPRESHDSWLAEKLAQGWTYGPEKDVDAKTHPCCVAYDHLPAEQRRKDVLFSAITEAMVAPL